MIQAVANDKPLFFNERYPYQHGGTLCAPSNVSRIVCDDIMAAAIALLSDQEIESMTREDMLDTARAARHVPRSPVKAEQIGGIDDSGLRRVLFHVRRWMRNRVDEQSKERGWAPYFRERF